MCTCDKCQHPRYIYLPKRNTEKKKTRAHTRARMHSCTHARTHARTHLPTHARAHAHTCTPAHKHVPVLNCQTQEVPWYGVFQKDWPLAHLVFQLHLSDAKEGLQSLPVAAALSPTVSMSTAAGGALNENCGVISPFVVETVYEYLAPGASPSTVAV